MKKITLALTLFIGSIGLMNAQNSFTSSGAISSEPSVTIENLLLRLENVGNIENLKNSVLDLSSKERRMLNVHYSGIQSLAPVVITQSNSQTIVEGAEIACASTSFRDNNLYRAFDLPGDFGIMNGLQVNAVEFAIGTISTPSGFPVTANIWSTPGIFPGGTLTLQGTAVYNATNADVSSIVSLPLSALIPAGETMVMELVLIDDGTETNFMRFGCNYDGETGPSYIMAPECDAHVPTPLSDLGLTQGFVWNVLGDAEPGGGGFPDPYCSVDFPNDVEPITHVSFAGINNTSSATVNGSPALEDFTAQIASVDQDGEYPVEIQGNTNGNFTTRIVVYIDWNQDEVFDDSTGSNEMYVLPNIVNSTGEDGIKSEGMIGVPAGALLGNTRMRVMKKWNSIPAPCNTSGYGQAEDYTINVAAGGGGGGDCTISNPGNNFEDGKSFTKNLGRIVANDLSIADGEDMLLNTITFSAFIGGVGSGVNADNVDVLIYEDNGAGAPGTLLNYPSLLGMIPTSQVVVGNNYGYDVWRINLDLTSANVELLGQSGSATTYWIGLSLEPTDGSNCFWEYSTVSVIGSGLAYNDGTGFIVEAGNEGVYKFTGECNPQQLCEDPYNEDAATSDVFISYIQLEGIGIDTGNPDYDFLYTSNTMSPNGYQVINSTMTVYPGLEGEYTVSSGPSGNTGEYYYSVWLDFNQDGCFDANEQIIWSENTITGGGIPNGQVGVVDVPVIWGNYAPGTYQARIRNSMIDHPMAEGNGDGEALDFTVEMITEADARRLLGIESQVFNNFTYYPNPVKDQLNLKANTPIEQVDVYNLIGQKVIQKQPNALEVNFATDQLQAGIYLMSVTIEGSQKTFRMVKE